MPHTRRRLERVSRWSWAFADAAVWVFAVAVATWLRFDFNVAMTATAATALVAVVAALAHVAVGAVLGPYRTGHQRGSFEETADVARAVVITSLFVGLWTIVIDPHAVPRTVPLIGGSIALAGMFATRFTFRSMRTLTVEQRTGDMRVIVFGAGEAGRRLLRSMVRDTQSGYFPVALLDDDKHKRRLKIEGVRVMGTREDMEKVAKAHLATCLVIALPQADSALIRELVTLASEAGLDAQVLPPLASIIGGSPTSRDLHAVRLEDLLGRQPVSLDTAVIAEQLAGRTVLVTGAGGSIGSELCRQIVRFGPAKLYMLDRDESGLLDTQMSISGDGLLQSDAVLLADIRDPQALAEVFEKTRPDIVFHAAALKHLPLLEAYPMEAWKTNVLGTLNMLKAAAAVGVGVFVNISTDKAANPTCVLGHSKRTAERLAASFAQNYPGRYVSVRFGNVLGSRGSVIHTFTRQIERGGPITITHPDVRRYFMLIPEACQLVLEASAIGCDGEVMVLEMGEQVKILDVAKTLIGQSGRRDIDIVFSGLRPGEKLSEELFAGTEERRKTANPLIDSVTVPPLSAAALDAQAVTTHAEALVVMRGLGAEPVRTRE